MSRSCANIPGYASMDLSLTLLGESMEYANFMPDAVLFDWDNTIVDSWRISHGAMNAVLDHFGRARLSEEDFLTIPQTSLKDNLPHFFADQAHEAETVYYDAYEKIHLDHLRLLPGASDLIQSLDEGGVPMAVVSNKTGKMLRMEVDFLNWNSYFEVVVGSRDLEHDKPSPIPALYALKACGVKPSKKVFFVGDSAVDLACARASGLTPVLVGGLGPVAIDAADALKFQDCFELKRFFSVPLFSSVS